VEYIETVELRVDDDEARVYARLEEGQEKITHTVFYFIFALDRLVFEDFFLQIIVFYNREF